VSRPGTAVPYGWPNEFGSTSAGIVVVVLVVLVEVVLDVLGAAVVNGTVVAVAVGWASPSLAALLHAVATRAIAAASARGDRRAA